MLLVPAVEATTLEAEEGSDQAPELGAEPKGEVAAEETPAAVSDAPAEDHALQIIAEARRLTGTNGRLKALHLLRKAGGGVPS